MNKKYVYAFSEGDGKNKQLLGGKGANLCEMTQIGLNVPAGFVISTEACLTYLADEQHRLPEGLIEEVHQQIATVEKIAVKVLVMLISHYWFPCAPVQPCPCRE